MNKKYFTISVGILVVVLASLSGFFWYTKTSNVSSNQIWTTYTQRFDSGDVISIDYPTELLSAYGPSYGAAGEKDANGMLRNAPAYVLHFYSRDNAKTYSSIKVRQHLPVSEALINSEKNMLTRSDVRRSPWHLGVWTAYEPFVPSLNGYSIDEYHFNINGRDLDVEFSMQSESDRERVMSSIRWNGVQMSKLDSMEGWDWPVLKDNK